MTRPPADSIDGRTPQGGAGWGEAQRRLERDLFARLAAAVDEQARTDIRNDIVVLHMPLVDYCARRFRDRSEPHADVVAVGYIGLIKAVDRFDQERGLEFSTFAMPTIMGEIRRYFRDRARIVRIPRRLIEIAGEAAGVAGDLQRRHGREPEAFEIAEQIRSTAAEVMEAQRCTAPHAVQSLDAVIDGIENLGDRVPSQLAYLPPELDAIELRCTLQPAVASLPEREQEILRLRFQEEMTQAAIATRMGMSQMHVSRLLARSLAELRSHLSDAA